MLSIQFYTDVGKFQSIELEEIWKNATLMNPKEKINENGNFFFRWDQNFSRILLSTHFIFLVYELFSLEKTKR